MIEKYPSYALLDVYKRQEKGLALYSNGVLIMDKCADLLPDYFSFVRGLVDSADLSLNISRELLQHDRHLKLCLLYTSAAMHDAIDLCTQYPDPHCRALRKALGQRWQLDPKYFFCANGAAEIFYRLATCLKPSRALLTAPTFGEYEMALRPTGCDIDFFTLSASEQFRITARILEQITDDLSLLTLCNPNNPTGCTIDPVSYTHLRSPRPSVL